MKKEKPIIIKFNFSKYYFEDKELIYYTNKGIYKYEELFPKSKGYENPLKIKKLELISIRFIFHEDDETMDYILVTELVIEWYIK